MGLVKQDFTSYIHHLQDSICQGLEELDGGKFREDRWTRREGGGGITRIIGPGQLIEKGGVNISMVHGEITAPIRQQLKVEGHHFFACGLSLVIHPNSPMIPTVHANVRYFELYDDHDVVVDAWFGGGADLTPYYLWEEDALHFHRTYKNACYPFGVDLYARYKKQCDGYFVNTHRGGECRGIGGIFYDYLRAGDRESPENGMNFSKAVGNAFADAYFPIVRRRATEPFAERERYWQELRRGRYVEFNLLHDRGTLFGLKSNGRTESILMSLPPRVRFDYTDDPTPGSREAELIRILKNPKNWC
jgi:coproporphyrinogen III oxidase